MTGGLRRRSRRVICGTAGRPNYTASLADCGTKIWVYDILRQRNLSCAHSRDAKSMTEIAIFPKYRDRQYPYITRQDLAGGAEASIVSMSALLGHGPRAKVLHQAHLV